MLFRNLEELSKKKTSPSSPTLQYSEPALFNLGLLRISYRGRCLLASLNTYAGRRLSHFLRGKTEALGVSPLHTIWVFESLHWIKTEQNV